MNSELFLKIPTHVEDVLTDFMLPTYGNAGETLTKGILPITELSTYTVKIYISEQRNDISLTGSVDITVGDASVTVSGVGFHVIDLTPTTLTNDKVSLIVSSDFNGGIWWVFTISDSINFIDFHNNIPISTFANPQYYISETSGVLVSNKVIEDTGSYIVTIKVSGSATFNGYLRIKLGDTYQDITSYGEHTITLPVTTVGDGMLKIIQSTGIAGEFVGDISLINFEGVLTYEYVQLDLYNELAIPLTFNIADIADITKRNASYSKTISLPGTPRNNKIFKHLYNIATDDSFELNKSIFCYILQGGVEVFNGSFELTKCSNVRTNNISYEGFVYSQTANLFSKIGGKYLIGNKFPNYDIDFSEYSEIITTDKQFDSWANPIGSGVLYAVIKKPNTSRVNGFPMDRLSPSLYIKEIFDKIITKAGYSYESNFLNSEYFKRLIYPFTDYAFKISENQRESKSSRSTGGVNLTQNVIGGDNPFGILTETVQNGGTYEIENGYLKPMGANGIWTCKENGNYSINYFYRYGLLIKNASHSCPTWHLKLIRNFWGNLKYDRSSYSVKIDLKLRRDGVDTILASKTKTYSSVDNVFMSNTSSLVIWADELTYSNKIYLKEGDEVWQKTTLLLPTGTQPYIADSTCVGDGDAVDFDFVIQEVGGNSYFNIVATNEMTNGMMLNPTNILHKNIKQSDFISSIVKMFNLYFEPISDNKFIIEPRDDFFALTDEAIDWTNKVATDKAITIVNSNTLFDNKKVIFKYADDVDYLNEKYLDEFEKSFGEYIFTNENYGEDLKFELIFASTLNLPIDGFGGNDTSMPAIYAWKEYGVEYDFEKSYKPRILYYGGVITTPDYINYYDELGNIIVGGTNVYPYCGVFDSPNGDATTDLNFDVCETYYDWEVRPDGAFAPYSNLYNRFYANMLAEYSDKESKIVTMYLKLIPNDIANFTFTKFVFIAGIYYRVNKIFDYVPGILTKVELLKIQLQNLPKFSNYSFPDKGVTDYENDVNIKYIDVVDGMDETSKYNALVDIDVVDAMVDATFKSNPIRQIDVINNSNEINILYPNIPI